MLKLDWLPTAGPAFDPAAIDAASTAWADLVTEPHSSASLAAFELTVIHNLMTALEAMDALRRVPPITLCQGDSHVGNLLEDNASGLVWADWQEICLGQGTDDLTHLIARARADGAKFSDDRVVAAYHAEFSKTVDISAEEVRRAVQASELLKILLHWPFYMVGAPRERIEALLEHARHLARSLNRSWQSHPI
jgi:thiamine kinase-like enzyme